LKAHYKNDPVFKQTKVIYSVYENAFKNKLSKNFLKKAPLKQDDPAFKPYEVSDNTGLNLGGVALADGVVVGSENIAKEVSALIAKNGKPVLGYKSEEEFLEACEKFYTKFIK
jgi:starch synthase